MVPDRAGGRYCKFATSGPYPLLRSNDTQSLQRHRFVSPVRKLASVFDRPTVRSVAFVAIVLVVANLALLVGVTTPKKFYFDKMHSVPAARQMLEAVLPSQLLNPDASAAGERV